MYVWYRLYRGRRIKVLEAMVRQQNRQGWRTYRGFWRAPQDYGHKCPYGVWYPIAELRWRQLKRDAEKDLAELAAKYGWTYEGQEGGGR